MTEEILEPVPEPEYGEEPADVSEDEVEGPQPKDDDVGE